MKIKKLNLYDVGVILIIFIGIFNTSQFGATFSWILAPALLLMFEFIIFSKKIVLSSMHLIAFLFWLICAFSTIISSGVDVKRDIITFLLFVLLFILITGNPKLNEHKTLFFKAYTIIGILAVFNILYNYINGIFYNQWFQRSTVVFLGVSRDPNYVGAFLSPIPATICFTQKKDGGKLYKLCTIIGIVLTFVALIVDGSRGALISAMIPLILYFFLQTKNLSKKLSIILLCVVLGIIGVNLAIKYLPPQTIARLLFMESADTRSELWVAALKGFYSNPIVGEGMNSATFYAYTIGGNHSHNMYIDILSASGIIGMSLYFALLWLTIKGAGNITIKKILFSISFHLPMFFLNGFNSLTMWIPIIMCYMYSLINDEENNKT